MNNIDINSPSFNSLSEEDRGQYIPFAMVDPFNLPENQPMINPYSMKLFGAWRDGEHFSHNPLNSKLIRKYFIKDNKVLQVWVVDGEEFKEVLPHEDGTWDVELFK